jgi:hypothetical protein
MVERMSLLSFGIGISSFRRHADARRIVGMPPTYPASRDRNLVPGGSG